MSLELDNLMIELDNKYGEWMEMGHPREQILAHLLLQVRQKLEYYDRLIGEKAKR